MDDQSTFLFNRVSHHLDEALSELNITTVSPQMWILGVSLNTLGVSCKLTARALQCQEDWGNGFRVSTMVLALGFPDGDAVGRLGARGWPDLQAQAEQEVINISGSLPENSEWADIPDGSMFAMMSRELKDVGEEKLQQISDRIVACVHSDLLQSDTPQSVQQHKSTPPRL